MSALVKYYMLSDIDMNVKVRINSVQGKTAPDLLELCSAPDFEPDNNRGECEMYVTAQIYSDAKPLGTGCSTSCRPSTPPNMVWNEWLSFVVKYRDLCPTSQLVFTVWEVVSVGGGEREPVALGGSCVPMFNKKGLLKLGRRRLKLWPGQEGDGASSTTTPYKLPAKEEIDKLHKLIRRYEQKELPSVKWMDTLMMRRINKIQKQSRNKAAIDPILSLLVDLPAFPYPVVYHQQQAIIPPAPEVLPYKHSNRVFVLLDPEMERDNPVERKYYKLARSGKGFQDRDLKPSVAARNKIRELLVSPNKKLRLEEKQLLWKYRWSLVENKRALPKFLLCVDWGDTSETKQGLELMEEWAVVDLSDALELLSADFRNEEVRNFAVKRLQTANDEDLESYLLQLVQALRYEQSLPNALFTFLMRRAGNSLSLTNFLYWYLVVETNDKSKGAMFSSALEAFMDHLRLVKPEWRVMIEDEAELCNQLSALIQAANANKKVDKKIEKMKSLLGPGGEMIHMREFKGPVRMPVRPSIEVTGLLGEKSTMFKSALAPLLAHFKTTGKEDYKVIFKVGDDLRQDQLIIQLINLTDSLLKKVNLDLKLTPYKVLATSPDTGFVEFVPKSHTVTSILENYDRDIRKFFHKYNPKPQQLSKALDTFVKSCAGYCVITYILGIGDRHLENVMITTSGHLFHIDFGYVFGKEPPMKSMAPPIKFSKEMVEAMGGSNSSHYMEFRNYCCLALRILRKHSGLILNLLGLMADANIPDLSDNVEKNLLKVQEKFRLDLNDEETDKYLLALVDDCLGALTGVALDKIHHWANYFK